MRLHQRCFQEEDEEEEAFTIASCLQSRSGFRTTIGDILQCLCLSASLKHSPRLKLLGVKGTNWHLRPTNPQKQQKLSFERPLLISTQSSCTVVLGLASQVSVPLLDNHNCKKRWERMAWSAVSRVFAESFNGSTDLSTLAKLSICLGWANWYQSYLGRIKHWHVRELAIVSRSIGKTGIQQHDIS